MTFSLKKKIKNIKYRKWYFKTWKRLNSYKLKKLKTFDLEISFDDLFNSAEKRKVEYYLGAYSKSGIEYALKKFKIYDILNKNGFLDLKLVTQLNNPFKQRIAIFNKKINPSNLLAELVTHKKSMVVKSFTNMNEIDGRYDFLAIEWLCLQNPEIPVKKDKPLLPGQKYLGLGIGSRILSILYLMTCDLKLAGIFNIPEYYHNAAMYSKKFHFIDPDKEGFLMLINKELEKKWGLATVSWAIDRQFVTLNGKPFKSFTSPQIIPINKKLQKYFKSSQYSAKVKEVINNSKFEFDHDGFKQSLKEHP
ncbi:MAG: hypothetical protein KAR38_01275, partial [Calditrichia bacterium]|nr:hypothetical protein [Calditrichia bacterium]